MEGILEPYTSEEMAIAFVQSHAQLGKRLTRVRHQALAAGLVDYIGACLDDCAIDAALTECNCGGEAGGATANNQNVS
jgi:hypothetical protein